MIEAVRSRRRPIVVVILIALASAGGFGYGYLCSEMKLPGYLPMRAASNWCRQCLVTCLHHLRAVRGPNIDHLKGLWNLRSELPEARGLSDEQRAALAKLLSLGYASGSKPAPEVQGVTTYVRGQAYDGLNLVLSGHAAEAVLMDMTGKRRHGWAYEFSDAFPVYPESEEDSANHEYWRRAHLYPNGDLLAIFEGFGLIKLDKDSKLVWANPRRCHHDLCVDKRGFIYVLSRRARILPRVNKDKPVLEDFITILDPDGHVLREISLLEAFERSSYASALDKMANWGDLFHTNTVELLDGSLADRSPAFKKGNILISILTLDMIAIVDMEQVKVVWALSGQWKAQHQPTMLGDGHILLLDNQGHHGMSKVIEFDPFTQAITWAYEGSPENGFRTYDCGSNQRLPNGNTLITESDSGKSFELTRDKRLVWEYYNPARAGRKGELIATLFEVVRLPSDFPTDWLSASWGGP